MSVSATPALEAFLTRAGSGGAALEALGLPGRKVEAWRYTPLRDLATVSWSEAPELSLAAIGGLMDGIDVPEVARRFVFANGREIAQESALPGDFLREESADVAPLADRFSAVLNAALAMPGLSLRVPEGRDGGTIALVSLTSGETVSTHLRHRIVLEKGASLTLLEVDAGEGRYIANPRLDVAVGEGATLRHVKIQRESADAAHLAIISARVESNGAYDSFTLNRGGALARHEVVADLAGRHASAHINGVQIVDGARLNDLTSLIRHAAPDCASRQTVKTVLSEGGQGVFQGKILVERIAQKTDGYQMNQALLLSERARIDSKPELEIYADDVKCSHGATVGALDEDQLFYLRSRGIPEIEARSMLVKAFLTGAVDLVSDAALRDILLRAVAS